MWHLVVCCMLLYVVSLSLLQLQSRDAALAIVRSDMARLTHDALADARRIDAETREQQRQEMEREYGEEREERIKQMGMEREQERMQRVEEYER